MNSRDKGVSRSRRTVLSVPGSSQRFLAKAANLDADEVLYDLEDSVSTAQKSEARSLVSTVLRRLPSERPFTTSVRLNDWSSGLTLRDLYEVLAHAGGNLDVVMLPKVETSSEVVALELCLTQIEREVGWQGSPIGIEALIETPTGVNNARAIAKSSSRVEAICYGPVDMAASVGALRSGSIVGDLVTSGLDALSTAVLIQLVLAGREAGVQVIDGPSVAIGDLQGLQVHAAHAASMGLDGKMVIHPDHLAAVNNAFTPDRPEYAQALSVVKALDGAPSDQGAAGLGGLMIDEATRKLARGIVQRGRAAGLSDSPK